VARYTRATRELEDYKTKYDSQLAANELLGTRTKDQAKQLADLGAKADEETKRARRFEHDASETVKLREMIQNLQSDYDKQAKKLDEYEEVADTTAVALLRKYNAAWYVAAGGWALSILLALGLVAGYAMMYLPGTGEEQPETPAPPAPEGPAIRIN
jgi:hypothetical protein